jgi:hypothetical protein
MAFARPDGQECPQCHLINPPAARRCVCGRDLVSAWQRDDEREAAELNTARSSGTLMQAISALIFLGVLWLAYQYADSL